MKEILKDLTYNRVLTKDEARKVLIELASGHYNASLTSAFMTIYMMRSITVAELQGFRDAMLELCVPITFDEPVIDVCGTGGDGKDTFNISTLASFIVAASGQPVAKHGNYGVSSACGSSNVLEFLGYKFTNSESILHRSMDKANICFMHAPLFHPAMKNVAPVRRDLGVKTFFNMLGPMVNPARPPRQLVGVFSLELARLYGYLYQDSQKKFAIIHSIDGYDEVSLTGPVKLFRTTGEYMITPRDFGLETLQPNLLYGGETVEEAAQIFENVLLNKGTKAQENAVLANAALALQCGNEELDLVQAVEIAREALRSGKAYQSFKTMVEISQEV